MPKLLAAAALLMALGACAAPLAHTAAKASMGAAPLTQAMQAPPADAYHKRAAQP